MKIEANRKTVVFPNPAQASADDSTPVISNARQQKTAVIP